jgi:2-haloacid dehalogenase/putative hydrolase of the HAD superfamily
LIDWETGIRNAFRQALKKTRADPRLADRAFNLYEEEERKFEKKDSHMLYRDILSGATLAVAARIGWKLTETQSNFLSEDLPRWVPFPDTGSSLKSLSEGRRLGILSNVDDDLIEATLKHFPVRFDLIVTAEKVRSYKPGLAHFEEARRIIGDDRTWLHVAASWYHDIEPAANLGIHVVWVNRTKVPSPRPYLTASVKEVRDLMELVKRLEANDI